MPGEDSKLIYIGLLAVILALVAAFVLPISPNWGGGQFPTPTPTPTPPPTFTYQTAVTIEQGWLPGGNPTIKSIDSWRITQYAVSEPKSTGISWLPWGGKLKLEVVTPSNKVITQVKTISIDLGSTKTFYFVWKTQEIGRHTITVTLINGDGVVVDQKTAEVVVNG